MNGTPADPQPNDSRAGWARTAMRLRAVFAARNTKARLRSEQLQSLRPKAQRQEVLAGSVRHAGQPAGGQQQRLKRYGSDKGGKTPGDPVAWFRQKSGPERKKHFSGIFLSGYFANPEKATIFATQMGD